MPTHPWVIRVVLVLALAGPLSLFVLGQSSLPPHSVQPPMAPPRAKETELREVYARLSEECLFQNLHKWCGLRVSDATPDEAALLRAAVEDAPDPKQVWCGPLDDSRRNRPPKTYKFPEGIRWYRLSHPTDPNQWIAIGVSDHYDTMAWTYWIRCRVPVGFEP